MNYLRVEMIIMKIRDLLQELDELVLDYVMDNDKPEPDHEYNKFCEGQKK